MTYRYHPELQELVDDPAGFPPAEKFVGTLEEMRAFADPLYAERRDLPRAEGVVARDGEIETADGYPMRARWYRKEGADARSAVMYVHGGGMILMGIDEMDADISRYVALSGVPFLSIGYRLAPEHPRPQAEDALDGYLWLIGHADELGIDAHRVAIMGDSGGAGIAATQQQPQNAPPFAVPQSIKINAGNIITPAAVQQQQPPQPQQPPIAQAPTPTNTPVQPDALSTLTKMSDDQLTGLLRQAKAAQIPNHLNDAPDITQKFAFVAGVNEKPTVLDDASFDQYLKDNHIPRRDILARSVNPITFKAGSVTFTYTAKDVTDMLKYSSLNYIGGKHGGQVYGAGTYFDKTGGRSTGYGNGTTSATAIAVLNPQTAHPISLNTLRSRIPAFQRSHPKFAQALGRADSDNYSIYAMAMGYNVITSDVNGYHNIIDRKALVYRASDN